MRKQLTAIGNSVGLIIDKATLDRLGLEKGSEVNIHFDGERLIIEPADEAHRKRLAAAAKRVMEKHAETLRKLAK